MSTAMIKTPNATRFFLLMLLGFWITTVAYGQPAPIVDGANYFLDTPQTNKFAMIITGPTVGESNENQFRNWSFALHDVLLRDYGYTSDSVILLYADGEDNSSSASYIDGAADRAGIDIPMVKDIQRRLPESHN